MKRFKSVSLRLAGLLIVLAHSATVQSAEVSCPGGVCPAPYRTWHAVPPDSLDYQAYGYDAPPPRGGYDVPRLGAETHDAVCSIRAGGSMGSGVLVESDGQAGIIVTAAHVVECGGAIVATFRDGRSVAGGHCSIDKFGTDIAAIVVERLPSGLRSVEIGAAPVRGEYVLACGFGGDGQYAAQPNRIAGVASMRQPNDALEMVGRFRSGDSGGPVFNTRGELVAIINASRRPGAANQDNVATQCGPLRAFLQRVRQRFAGLFRRHQVSPDGPITAEKPPVAPEIATPAVDDLRLIERLHKRLDELAGAQRDSSGQTGKLLDEIKKSLVDVSAAGKINDADRTKLLARLDELKTGLHGKLAGLASREDVQAVLTNQDGAKQSILAVLSAQAPAAGRTLGVVVAQALGLSRPLGAGVAVAGWLIGRRIGSKIDKKKSAATAEGTTGDTIKEAESTGRMPVAHDPRQNSTTAESTKEFVTIEVPSRRLSAMEMALEEYVRRYPAARGLVEIITGYADQFEIGMGEKKK